MEEKIRIVRKFNQENRYRDGGVLNNAIDDTLNELERLQKENNDLRAIRETVRYIEEDGEKDDLYYVVGRGTYLADVLENAQDFEKTVHTCLHCNENTPLYCEKCYQELISKNAELQLENEKLKEKHKITCELNVGLLENTKECIPKSKVRDKLEEVNKEYKKYTEKWEKLGMNKEHPFYRYIVRLEAQIDILEELLNEVN